MKKFHVLVPVNVALLVEVEATDEYEAFDLACEKTYFEGKDCGLLYLDEFRLDTDKFMRLEGTDTVLDHVEEV